MWFLMKTSKKFLVFLVLTTHSFLYKQKSSNVFLYAKYVFNIKCILNMKFQFLDQQQIVSDGAITTITMWFGI